MGVRKRELGRPALQTEFGDQFLDGEFVVGGDGFQDAAELRGRWFGTVT